MLNISFCIRLLEDLARRCILLEQATTKKAFIKFTSPVHLSIRQFPFFL